jgi:hypothetical protein
MCKDILLISIYLLIHGVGNIFQDVEFDPWRRV